MDTQPDLFPPQFSNARPLFVREDKTYGRLRHNGDRWLLSDIHPVASRMVKRLFPRIPAGQARNFILSDAAGVATDLLWLMQRFPLLTDRETTAALEGRHDQAVKAESERSRVLSGAWTPPRTARWKPNRAPYPYQAAAAEVALLRGSLLLMDDLGLGKTISGIATMLRADQWPAIVVCPTHLASQWQSQIEAFTTLSTHIVKKTTPYDLPPADVVIITYSKLAGWIDFFADGSFKTVVFDEVQDLRTGTRTAKGKAAEALTSAATCCLGLSATPVYNYGSEVWSILYLLRDDTLGTMDEFAIEWCRWDGKRYVVNEPDLLGEHLREIGATLKRTEDEVDKQLPPLNLVLHQVDYDASEIEAVEDRARMLAMKVTSGSFTESGEASRQLDLLMRQATGVAKANDVAAMVDMIAQSGERVLLAGWHREVYERWQKLLGHHRMVLYTGTESPKQKDRAKAAFVEGESRVMAISLRSGAGLDGLQDVCRTVVVGELDWSPMVLRQLYGRLRRPGQTAQVDAILCHTDGGSDPVIIDLLGLKTHQAAGVTDPGTGLKAHVSDQSRMKVLASRILEETSHG